jgi:hypothetical protein
MFSIKPDKVAAIGFTLLAVSISLGVVVSSAAMAAPTEQLDRDGTELEEGLDTITSNTTPEKSVTVTRDLEQQDNETNNQTTTPTPTPTPERNETITPTPTPEENETSNQTATPTPTPTPEPTPDPTPEPTPIEEQTESEPKQLEDQIGDLNVHDYEFTESSNGNPILRIDLTWTGRAPETATITQLPGRGADRLAISRNRLIPNERTEITVDLVADDEPAILYTTQSLENERAIVLDPRQNTSTETTLIRGLSIGALTMLLGTIGAAWRYYNIDKEPVEGWEP